MRKILVALVLGLVLLIVPVNASADNVLPTLPAVPTVTVTLPVATVTLPPRAPVTITPDPIVRYLRGPVRTVTVTANPKPRAARTIFVPGPTRYVRVPGPTATVTDTPHAVPTQTVSTTATVTATKTVWIGQKPVPSATVSPQNNPFVQLPQVSLSKPEAVGYSLAGVAAVAGLIILGLWLGYILGWKDKERRERKFLDALRDQFYTKGKHK